MPIDLSSAITPGQKREAHLHAQKREARLQADALGRISQPMMDGGDGGCEISPHDHARDR